MSGRRNEPARARHRVELKRNLSLTSVPQSELETSGGSIGRKLSLSNHFGWVVLGKSKIGDGVFPHLSEFYEKPDPQGRDFQKVTYVLFMDKGVVIDKNTEVKHTQTTVTGAEGEPQVVAAEPLPTKEKRVEKGKPKRRSKSKESAEILVPERKRTPQKKRKIGERKRKSRGRYLISEFYFIPKEDRSLSRSTKDTSGDVTSGEYEENRKVSRNKNRRYSRSRSRGSNDKTVTHSGKKKKGRKSRRSRSSKSSGESDGDDGKKKKKSRSRSHSKASSRAGSKEKKKRPKKRTGPDRWQLRAPAGAEKFDGDHENEYKEQENSLYMTKTIYRLTDPMNTRKNKQENQTAHSVLRTATKKISTNK